MADFQLVESQHVLQTEVFEVRRERAEHPSGAALDRHVTVNAPATVILPLNEVGELLLVRQFRLPVRTKLWELPAGRCDPGEEEVETARRELIEETGLRAKRWTRLLDFVTAPGFSSERMIAFLAEDLTAGEAEPEPYELIETRWVNREDALAMIRHGEIRDAKTITTILYCQTFVFQTAR
ncbi:MAG: NUDIX domain-containing protein [Acidobacteria bacterium]|nr:NUDIX domain-containing protein [Acidobacteriota bacterium]